MAILLNMNETATDAIKMVQKKETKARSYTQHHHNQWRARKKRNSNHPTNKPKLKKKFSVIMYDEFFAIQRTRTIHLLRTVKTISVCECRWQQQRTYCVFVLTKWENKQRLHVFKKNEKKNFPLHSIYLWIAYAHRKSSRLFHNENWLAKSAHTTNFSLRHSISFESLRISRSIEQCNFVIGHNYYYWNSMRNNMLTVSHF